MKSFCEKLAISFYKHSIIKAEDINPLRFAFELIVTQVMTFGTIIIIGLFLDCFLSTIIYCICFILARRVFQGYHAKTFLSCYILTVLFYIFIQTCMVFDINYEFLNIFTFILLGIYICRNGYNGIKVIAYTLFYIITLILFCCLGIFSLVRMCSLILFFVLVLSNIGEGEIYGDSNS